MKKPKTQGTREADSDFMNSYQELLRDFEFDP